MQLMIKICLRQPCGTAIIETETLPLLLKHQAKVMKLKPTIMQVRPHLLYKPDLNSGSSPPDPSTNYHLLDRVVNVRQGYSVPLGCRGTVIGIKNAQKTMDVIYEVLFDTEFAGGLPVRGVESSPTRVYHVPPWSLINLTHGQRQQIEKESQGKPTAVVRPSGNNLKQQQQPMEANRNQQARQSQSYKSVVEQPAKAPPVQPKLLTRSKTDSVPTASRGGASHKSHPVAPSPSSLPSPFLDIWDTLIRQHQQNTTLTEGTHNAPPPIHKEHKEQRQPKPKPPSGSNPSSLQVHYHS